MKYFILFCLSVFVSFVNASPLPDFPFVAVTGEASQEVKPDKAIVSFRIVTFAKQASQASDDMAATTGEVVDFILSLGVPSSSITSFEVDKQTKRKRGEDYNRLDILGYDFIRRIEVEIDQLSLYATMVDGLMKLNNVESFTTQFDTSQRNVISEALFATAAANARNKAEVMAKGLGTDIDSVFAFNDSGSFDAFFATFGLSNSYSANLYAKESRMRSSNGNTFIPQFITIKKRINVIYRLD